MEGNITTSVASMHFTGPEIDKSTQNQLIMSLTLTVGSFMAHMGDRLSEAQRQMRQELEQRQEL